MKSFVKLLVPLCLSLLPAAARAETPVDNPGQFPEYFCGTLTAERYIGAPASLSGNKAALQNCAARFAMAEAVMSYGTRVEFKGLKSPASNDSAGITHFIFQIQIPHGKIHLFVTPVQVNTKRQAPDGNDAILVGLTTLGICEGQDIDSCD